jgi:hypothetical protein
MALRLGSDILITEDDPVSDTKVQCLKCGGENQGDSSFCTVCGASLKKGKATDLGLFLLSLLLWGGTVSHDTLGFVSPVSGEAIGFDAVAILFWLWPLYAGRKLYRACFPRGTKGL